MEIKFHYSDQDDVLTVYTDVAPNETIEFTDFMNIDINKDRGIVGFEIFDALEFLKKQDYGISKMFLSNLKSVNAKYDDWRNTWFIKLELKDNSNRVITLKLPPLKKSEYVSPLIASVA